MLTAAALILGLVAGATWAWLTLVGTASYR